MGELSQRRPLCAELWIWFTRGLGNYTRQEEGKEEDRESVVHRASLAGIIVSAENHTVTECPGQDGGQG